MITLDDYWMGRDKKYPLTPEIVHNAKDLLHRVNLLLSVYYQLNPDADKVTVSSGWRPPEVNRKVPNAAPRSHHMTGRAIDLRDPEGELDEFFFERQDLLGQYGLWLEHPSATRRWAHVQSVPPRSGKRVFYP